MTENPVVTVLHADAKPDEGLLAPVTEHATVRFAGAEDLPEALPGSHVLFAYDFFSHALPDNWRAADSLQWIHIASAGVERFIFPELRDSGVIVTNSRGIFDDTIAEYVLGQIISFAKDFPGSWQLQQQREWKHRDSRRVGGSRALIVGTGPIGRAIARLLKAAGVEVTASGRRARANDPDFGTVTAQENLEDALSHADYVIAIAPSTPQTYHMFDATTFRAMKDTACFINVARGDLVVTDDLIAALRAGTIAGAALDVTDPEPPPDDHPLWEAPNTVITPHHAGDVVGWRDDLTRLFADNYRRWAAGDTLLNVVDKERGYVPG
ncbi:D-2-hydroxyacid dehydrogenase [Hoyosella sp. YIM 151337]|uniref:D-2-hydroxyacid dehydrogenase n=1 Tax=Hoyosella sp. YIM 151337 TaxID=2992742 RepID=UPI002236154F|nr:D-2-hydroxyacid dehydrogenase [Hoyosella sp. YIM 151337]MCW4352104.1 D-2-hydroxyacid dehydrogenase [Hoyosella sp. YIM 151337]